MARTLRNNQKPLTKAQRITMLEKKLDRVVLQAESCGKRTQARKSLLLDADAIRDLLFQIEPRQNDVIEFMRQ